MKKPDSLEALEVPDEGAGSIETSRAAVALAAAAAAEAPSGGLRARLVGSVSRGGKFGIFADRLARLFDISIEAAEALVAKIEAGQSWKQGPAPGVEWLGVKAGPRLAGAVAAIGRLQPGARFPKHGHVGDETTLVMQGGFRDSSGIEVERGEELYEAPGTEHDFVILDGEECIAAVIAVGGVEFR